MNGVATVGSGSTGDSCCICAARYGSIRATPSTSAGLARGYVARDAMYLARLLRLDEICSVAVPSVEQEAARDLVRPGRTSVVI